MSFGCFGYEESSYEDGEEDGVDDEVEVDEDGEKGGSACFDEDVNVVVGGGVGSEGDETGCREWN